MKEPKITQEAIATLEAILRKGSQAEVKMEQHQVAIIELKRKLKYKGGGDKDEQ